MMVSLAKPRQKDARVRFSYEGRWYRLVGVRDNAAGEIRLYLDGQRVATVPAAAAGGISTGPLSVGRAEFAGQRGDFWDGFIDEVQAFGTALTDAEVTALYSEHGN